MRDKKPTSRRRRSEAATAAAGNPLKPKKDTVALRLYGQGLGDCFLLAFPTTDGGDRPFYVVIDCGIAAGTPDEEARMLAVAQDIHDATGGRIDVLAVTHEHYDHVSGFIHAETIWKKMKIGALWLPWTEKPGDEEADGLRHKKKSLNLAASRAAARALQSGGFDDDLSGLRMQGGFLGFDEGEVGQAAAADAFGASRKVVMERALDLVKALDEANKETVYCEPGDVRLLKGTGVQAYVLGPPRARDKDGKELNNERGKPLLRLLENEEAMYGYRDIGMAEDEEKPKTGGGKRPRHEMALETDPARDALLQALAGSGGDADEYDRYCPFDATLRVNWDDAMLQPFFWEHYASGPDWRRIDDDWLSGAPDLALRAGGITNNLSLVLAFEMPGTKKVLLFPGDAQVGNWLSWHRIPEWTAADDDAKPPKGAADMKEMLGRVAFYKVGHHGSHNATVREQGLEMMAKADDGTDADLIAYIPVSVPVAHDIMNYCPMPFYPVVRRLQEKTRGRVFLANGEPVAPLPPGVNLASVRAVVDVSPAKLPAKIRHDKKIEAEVPLWIQVSLEDA